MRIFGLASLIFLSTVSVCRGETLSNGEDVGTFVTRQILNSDVMLFAASYCRWCRESLNLLAELHDYMDQGNHYYENHESSHGEAEASWTLDCMNMDEFGEDGSLIHMELTRRTRQATVPNIFIGGEHIGGHSD